MARLKAPTEIGGVPIDPRAPTTGQALVYDGSKFAPGDVAVGGDLATKTYVDAQDALKLPLAGGSMSGFITLHANPSSPLHAAPKQYVDTAVAAAQGIPHYVQPSAPGSPVDGALWTNPNETASPGAGRQGASRLNSPVLAITTGTWTSCPMGSAVTAGVTWDYGGYYSAAASTRFTIPAGYGGRHRLTHHAEFAQSSTGDRSLRILVDGATAHYLIFHPTGPGAAWRGNGTIELELAAGSYVEFQVWHSHGSNLNLLVVRASIERTE